MNTMATAFVTQENPSLNYAPAEAFGDVQFLTRDDYSPIRSSLHNKALVDDIRTKLKGFNPDQDYVIVSGSPVVSAVVFMVLAEISKRINVLRWSNRDHQYQHIVLEV